MNEFSSKFEEYRSSETPPNIETPPNPEMKISIVVPVYAEYENGNIFRLIESLDRQTADPKKYEVVCLVNNTESAMAAKTDDYKENQKTLQIGRFLAGEDEALPSKLNRYREGVLRNAREKGIALHMVDLSTQGYEKNIGKIRDLGLTIEDARFKQTDIGQDGVIAQLDADTTIEPRYIEKALDAFKDPAVETLFVNLDYQIPEGDSKIYRTSFYHQFKIAFYKFKNVISGKPIVVGGPQTIARTTAYKKVGGFQHIDMGEDFRIANALSEHTKYRFGEDIRVYTADRARSTGYYSRLKFERLQETEHGYPDDTSFVRPSIRFAKSKLSKLAEVEPELLDEEDVIQSILSKYHLPYNAKLFETVVLKRKDTFRELSIGERIEFYGTEYFRNLGVDSALPSNEWVDEAIQLIRNNLAEEEMGVLDELIRENDLRAQIRLNSNRTFILGTLQKTYYGEETSFTKKESEFLERNPWIGSFVEELVSEHPDYESAVTYMKTHFPEYVEEYENSRLRRSTARLHALTIFARRVRNNPDEFPSAKKYLDTLKR